MIIDALVPVKAAVAGKTRLAAAFTPAQRADLVRAMLADVVASLHRSPLLRHVAVVSPDPDMLDLGAFPLHKAPNAGGLNEALAVAIARLVAVGAEALPIVPGEAPETGPNEAPALPGANTTAAADRPARPPLVRAAPSFDEGTGALFLLPPGVIAPDFGGASFHRHESAARRAGVTFEQVVVPALLRDIDRPDDVARLLRSAGASRTRTPLRRFALV